MLQSKLDQVEIDYLKDRDVMDDDPTETYMVSATSLVDVDELMKDERSKEIYLKIKMLGCWIKSNISLTAMEKHMLMESALNNMDICEVWVT